jgi:argininosuccinate lyase
MKLWSKENTTTSQLIEDFTVGRDKEFDVLLAEYDVLGSMAHVRMLGKVGLMNDSEVDQAIRGLESILETVRNGKFVIQEGVEDVHSQVEFLLIEQVGDVGKKIHSGRSRNDQVAVDLKLFLRAEITTLRMDVKDLFDLLIAQSDRFKNDLLPGYTHLQLAMPSSFGLWFGAYAESLVDDLEMLAAAYQVTNKNPLGSGAGYGSSFPLNRSYTTQLLNFKTIHHNSVYAQMSRGKTEKLVGMGISTIAATLSRLSMDCCLYLNQNFGFISFPSNLTTGSSIMPHKKNPDVFEMIRAKCNRIQSVPNELNLMLTNLPSGYHRDLQLTKEILFPALKDLKQCIQLAILMLSNIEVSKDILADEKYKYVFSVEKVNELVNQGIPFREAYKQVGNSIENGEFTFDYKHGLHHTHEGSIGNLSNADIVREMEMVLEKF